jgi:hypothetical protein
MYWLVFVKIMAFLVPQIFQRMMRAIDGHIEERSPIGV